MTRLDSFCRSFVEKEFFFLQVFSFSRSQDILGRCRISFGEDSRHRFLSSQLSTGWFNAIYKNSPHCKGRGAFLILSRAKTAAKLSKVRKFWHSDYFFSLLQNIRNIWRRDKILRGNPKEQKKSYICPKYFGLPNIPSTPNYDEVLMRPKLETAYFDTSLVTKPIT